MKKTFLFPAIAIATISMSVLASCGKSPETPSDAQAPAASGSSAVNIERAVAEGDTVAVDYVGKLDDGTIFDSSIKSEAEKAKNFNPNRDYSPLLFTVGAGQMIKGFDRGVLGMKTGEKRTLRIPPEEAYGTGGTEQVVPKKAVEDSFTEIVSREKYQDTFEVSVPESTFKDQGREVPKVGQSVTAGNIEAKVLKVEGGNVTMLVENRQNPFYGKKLAVGLEGDFEGNKVKITKLDTKNVTVLVDNRNNPFYGKKLAVGLEGMWNGEKYTVKKVDSDTVTLERSHELAGKTLTFEVELKEIK